MWGMKRGIYEKINQSHPGVGGSASSDGRMSLLIEGFHYTVLVTEVLWKKLRDHAKQKYQKHQHQWGQTVFMELCIESCHIQYIGVWSSSCVGKGVRAASHIGNMNNVWLINMGVQVAKPPEALIGFWTIFLSWYFKIERWQLNSRKIRLFFHTRLTFRDQRLMWCNEIKIVFHDRFFKFYSMVDF